MDEFNPNAPKVCVRTATGQVQQPSGTKKIALPNLPADFPKTSKVMPLFKHAFLGLSPICDADCMVVFTKGAAVIYDAVGTPIITGWRERDGARLWRIALVPDPGEIPNLSPDTAKVSLQAFSAYNLPRIEALVH